MIKKITFSKTYLFALYYLFLPSLGYSQITKPSKITLGYAVPIQSFGLGTVNCIEGAYETVLNQQWSAEGVIGYGWSFYEQWIAVGSYFPQANTRLFYGELNFPLKLNCPDAKNSLRLIPGLALVNASLNYNDTVTLIGSQPLYIGEDSRNGWFGFVSIGMGYDFRIFKSFILGAQISHRLTANKSEKIHMYSSERTSGYSSSTAGFDFGGVHNVIKLRISKSF